MKALFDPLVDQEGDAGEPRRDHGAEQGARRGAEAARRRAKRRSNALIAPYKQKLYDDRVAMLPADVQAIIRKPEKERTVAEQKIADDYFPVLRIDADKIQEVMPADVRKQYKELQATGQPGRRRRRTARRRRLPAFWTVEVDRGRGAGEELHPDQRRSRAAREGQAGRARLAVRARRRSISARAASKRSPTG